MGKDIAEWTDVDYAQAAIDMLPNGSVEEIAEFLRAQKIKGQLPDTQPCVGCPIAQWVNKWIDKKATVNRMDAYGAGWSLRLPLLTQRFIRDFDNGMASL